ncbi:hypothetical protein EV130_12041 [Rhizobium azibense]|uniref:Secreted protein with PEP-CTERM sorting signal n=2 Tax=Rhizobium azibense TaxID=1136135 RepID=A0A4V2VD56_9HYPH|nr:hypothetical protein [Rhizobium azibense]TCU15657.1 hypothetical protein EV130_12041 [Rhizobium azibense]TCU31415.1 hypothetical protein EV129_12841 [Rhizobium azibense]
MNLKSIALAAVIAASSMSTAYAATSPIDDLKLTYKQDGEFSTRVTTAQSFWSAFVTAFNANGYTSIYNSFKSLALDIDDYDWPSITFTAKKSDGAVSNWYGELNFNTANQSVSFGSSQSVGGTVQGNPTVAVPGPEAGAGLSALMMGGMAIWMVRRRKDQEALAA